jgi:uncharacterized protein (TIGR03382 family)
VKRAGWIVAFGLASIAWGAPLWGFELLRVNENPCDSGARNLSWSPPQARVDVSRLAAPFDDLAREAQSQWNDALAGRFSFVSGSGGSCDIRDGVTSLEFSDTLCGGGPFGSDVLAVTRSSWRSDGSLIDADIVFNTSLMGNRANFLQVAAHELGHVLGLDHSDACGASGAGTLMNSRLTMRLDGPQGDDIDGGRFIYSGGGGGEVPEGANGCAVVVPAGAVDGTAPLVVGLMALSWLRRRRRFSD